MSNNSFKEALDNYQECINQALETDLKPGNSQFSSYNVRPQTDKLWEAMRYSVLIGGKRLRPILVLATADALNTPNIVQTDIIQVAIAIEYIHSYSLIHDDLPSMDDDDLRRGQPTCHKAYDEATAILAGDALQALAIERVLTTQLTPEQKVAIASTLASASGANGMVGGQAVDLEAVNSNIGIDELETMHHLKTGALIRASVLMGAQCGNATAEQLQNLDHYAFCIGLAFQIQDDILDIEGATETLGKHQGADANLNKPTYPSVLGLEQAKQRAGDLHDQAIQALASFGPEADFLRELAHYIIQRQH